MRKLYLFSIPALVFSFSAAHAQSSPPPWPGLNYPTISGSGVSLGNVSTIQQIGSNEQVGSSASVVNPGGPGPAPALVVGSSTSGGTVYGVDQSVTDAKSGNYSEIYQGTNTSASSDNSAAVIQQAGGGAKNAANTTQDGNGNTAVTKQYTNARGAGSNPVTFNMPSFTFTNSSSVPFIVGAALETILNPGTFSSTIVQNGDGNTANVNQGSQLIAATGTDYSYVSQQATGALVDVSQQGSSNNWSSVSQSGTSSTFSDVTQLGSAGNNISFLSQTSPLYATITQSAFGGDNASYVSQSGGAINVTQLAFRGVNNSGIWQTDGPGTTTVTQTIGPLARGSSDSNTSTIWQSGITGSVSVTQNVILGGGTNTSDITQTGGGYTVNQTANGGTNVSDITSNGGTSTITQTASRGYTNESTVIQAGNDSATVTQSMAHSGGNNTSTIDQTLTGGSMPNQATVLQVASYGPNTSNITQTGYGNIANVHQH